MLAAAGQRRTARAPREVLLDVGKSACDVLVVDASALAVEDDLGLEIDLRAGDRVVPAA